MFIPKSLCTFLLYFFLTLSSLTGQEFDQKVKAVNIPIKGKVKEVKEIKAQLNLQKCRDGVSSIDSGTIRSNTIYTFNQKGNITSKRKTNYNQKDSVTVVDEEYYWDNGFKSKKINRYIQGAKKNDLSELRYKENGDISEEIFFNKKGELMGLEKYTYNSFGDLTLIESVNKNGESFIQMDAVINDNERVVEERYFDDYDKKKIKKSNYLEYDSTGMLVKKTIVSHKYETRKFVRLYEYFGNKTIEVSRGKIDDDGKIQISHKILYNNDFRDIRFCGKECVLTEYHPNGQTKKTTLVTNEKKIINEYDNEGNWINSYFIDPNDNLDNSTFKKPTLNYEYDKKGNWTKKVKIDRYQCFCFERELTYYED